MISPELFNDPVAVTMTTDSQGNVTLRNITWQAQQHTIVAMGRQWTEADGRHLMAEAADGTRFELQLRRQDLIWYVRKAWRRQTVA